MTIQYHIEEETPHNSSRVYVRFLTGEAAPIKPQLGEYRGS